jgi:hypothetical protein
MHYFINEITEYTKYYVEHIDELPSTKYNVRLNGQRIRVAIESKFYLSTSELIPLLYKQNCFRVMAYDEYVKFPQVRYQLSDNDDLHYTEGLSVKRFVMKNERKDNKNASIWFADFESTTDGEKHEAFMACYSNEDGTDTGCHHGKNCGKALLNYLPDGANVYFHNLAYDGRLMAMYGVTTSIQKGSKIYTMTVHYKNKHIYLKDSLCLLQMPLRSFPSAFGFEECHKEVFPYNYYCKNRLTAAKPRACSEVIGLDDCTVR